jgi:hypothetical protein
MSEYENLISDAPDQKINLYKYGARELTTQELFFCLMVEETMRQLGVQDVYAVILFLLGRPNISTRAKVKYAIEGTSVASVICRALFDVDMPFRMSTLTGKTLATLRIRWTTNLGGFIGRQVPYLGWAIGVYDVIMINVKTIARYNSIVKPEDRIDDATVGTLG